MTSRFSFEGQVKSVLEEELALLRGRDDFLAGSARSGSTLPAAGHRMGPWTIEAPLGEGGMASVWLARRSDGRHDGQAAIKLMHGRLHGSQASQRFERDGAGATLRQVDDTRDGRDRSLKPILLLAHIDVVEANPADWTRDPFTLVEENGYFFARGASDDKALALTHAVTLPA